MEENSIFHERYMLERLLGRGNFSEVWLAKDTKTDVMVALKIYAPATGLDDTGLNLFAREFALVVNANHKNLLKPLYYDSYERKPYLVLPYCKNGSVASQIGNLTEEEAWRMLRDVASGLSWLHNLIPPVIHQDIKPDNIMIGDSGHYMITDFGVSTHLRSALRKSMSLAFTSAGTIAYMAPERFSKDNTPIMANDIYSLGATVYEMLTGDTPFGEDGGLIQKKGAEIPSLDRDDVSSQLQKVIEKCLAINSWERPTAEQLEEYAETALKGQKIKFGGEQNLWNKHKRTIIGAVIAAIIIIASTLLINCPNSSDTTAVTNSIDVDSAEYVAPSAPAANESNITSDIVEAEETLDTSAIQTPVSRNDNPTATTIAKTTKAEIINLSLSPQSLKFKGKGGKPQLVNVHCNTTGWKVANKPKWVHVTKINTNTITIDVDKNTSKQERSGTLVIKCGDKKCVLTIVQARVKALGII